MIIVIRCTPVGFDLCSVQYTIARKVNKCKKVIFCKCDIINCKQLKRRDNGSRDFSFVISFEMPCMLFHLNKTSKTNQGQYLQFLTLLRAYKPTVKNIQ